MDTREALGSYLKRVHELREHVRSNEQATKQSLIGPLFSLLGYDLTDPRECVPEYRADFGPGRSNKPIDWSFHVSGRPAFFVEAKEVGKRLGYFDEQLADYFAKVPEVKLGVLTNGVQWRFFTDVVAENIMDREPFLVWDVLSDDQPPYDFLTLLQKSNFNSQLVRSFAERKRNQNLLVTELTRLLEPAPEFVKLAVSNIESRMLTSKVVEEWKPIIQNAIEEWARQRTLTSVLEAPRPAANGTGADEADEQSVVTTQEELTGLETVRRLLGPSRPVTYEDTLSYFKIHLPERYTWVVCRLYFGRKRPLLWVPLPADRVQDLVQVFPVSSPYPGWSTLTLSSPSDLEHLGDLLRLAWDTVRLLKTKGSSPLDGRTEEREMA
jgi:hypothetical protein